MFLRNFWYVAAWDHEIGREPVGYIFLNEPVVLFRRQDGTPVALEDRCAHRLLPLSKGEVLGDTIVCGYHGLTYDAAGKCIHIPGQADIPSWAVVKAYPVVERYKCIWIWMGDPALADPATITDLHWADDPGWGAKDRRLVNCHYQLISDNLGDLSHLSYVHAERPGKPRSNIGTTKIAEAGEIETKVKGDNVVITRWTIDESPPSAYRRSSGFNSNVDRWQISDFSPPAFFKLNFGVAPTGTGVREGKRARNQWSFQVCQWATPETERTTHYFWGCAHNFGPDRDPATAAGFFNETMPKVIAEDVAVIEAQQRSIDLDPAVPRHPIKADEAVLAAQQVVARLLAEEAKANLRKP